MNIDNPASIQVKEAFECGAVRLLENNLVQTRQSELIQPQKKLRIITGPVSSISRSDAKNGKALPNPLTLDFSPDPWIISGTAGQLYQFDTIRFSICENKGAQYALAWKTTSLGWRSLAAENDQTPEVFIEIESGAGDALDFWRIGRQAMPGGGSHLNLYTNPKGKPNILSVPTLCVKITIGAATWSRC